MIVVTIDPALAEPGGQTRFEFDELVDRITFGREGDRSVSFRKSDARLGGKHFDLRQVAGTYEIAIDRTHPVFIDGVRLIANHPLLHHGERQVTWLQRKEDPGFTEVRLVNPTSGPWIRISFDYPDFRVRRTITDTLTAALPPIPPIGGWVTNARNLATAAIAGCVALAGFWAVLWWTDRQAEAAFAGEVMALFDRQISAAASSRTWSDIMERHAGSVYLIEVDNGSSDPEALATAWVYDSHTLVTAAHVARHHDPSHPLVAVSSDGGVARTVVEVFIHPAYQAFRETVAPLVVSGGGKGPIVGSYDVAFLKMDPAAELGPPLDCAEPGEIDDLKVGDDVAMIAYLIEGGRFSPAQLRPGSISGATDFFGFADGDGEKDLLFHTMDGQGGASGAPIFNRSGKVVATFSGGETVKTDEEYRLPTGQAFYAQRASLIADLATGWSAEMMDAEKARWQTTATFLQYRREIWSRIRDKETTGRISFDNPAIWEESGTTAVSAGRLAIESGRTVEITEKGLYIAFLTSEGDARFGLRLKVGGRAVDAPFHVDRSPLVIFSAEPGSDVIVAVVGPPGTDYKLQIQRLSEI